MIFSPNFLLSNMTSTYLKDLQDGLHAIFAENPKAILLGEDVLHPYGGAFKVTSDLSLHYPGRVLTTPISEAAITGVGAGLALRGYLPIVEIMFGDFLTLCADQIVNHATKFPAMFPETDCPLIIRTPMGGGRGYGPTHSQSLEKMFLGIPGLKLIAPSHFHQPGRLLRRVVAQEKSPTIFIENKLLYGIKLHENSDELPQVEITDNNGYDITLLHNYVSGEPDVFLIAYGGSSRHLTNIMHTLAKEEIRVQCALPACIDPAPIDELAFYAAQSGRVVVVDEGYGDFSWAEGIAAKLYSSVWRELSAPIHIVTSDRAVIPTSPLQEEDVLISGDKIKKTIFEVLSWV